MLDTQFETASCKALSDVSSEIATAACHTECSGGCFGPGDKSCNNYVQLTDELYSKAVTGGYFKWMRDDPHLQGHTFNSNCYSYTGWYYDSDNTFTWRNLFRLTNTVNDCCGSGNRVMAIFRNSTPLLHFPYDTSTAANTAVNMNIPVKLTQATFINKWFFVSMSLGSGVWTQCYAINLSATLTCLTGALSGVNYTWGTSATTSSISIGDQWNGLINGKIADHRFYYNTCLSSAQFTTLYQQRITFCAAGCQTCATPFECTTCNSGYYLSSGICYSCNTSCQTCTGGGPSMCVNCIAGYYLQPQNSHLCLATCPSGYSPSGTSCSGSDSCIIQIQFTGITPTTIGGTGITAINGATLTYFPPSFEASDPIPSKRRGYYFSGSQYVQLPPATNTVGSPLMLASSCTFATWIRPQGSGTRTIFSKKSNTIEVFTIRINASNNVEFVGGVPITTYAHVNTLTLDSWVFLGISFSLNAATGQTTLTFYYNGVAHATVFSSAFFIRDVVSTFNQIVGASSILTDFYSGFIWSLKICNSITNTFASEIISAGCPAGLTFCLSACPFLQTPECGACSTSCNNGCVRTTDCSLCDDELCNVCSAFFTTPCTTCIANTAYTTQCNCVSGRFFNRPTRSCDLCPTTCNGCTSLTTCTGCYSNASVSSGSCVCNPGYYPNTDSTNCQPCGYQCSQCTPICTLCFTGYYLIGGTCTCVCPSGYTQTGGNCVGTNQVILDFTFDKITATVNGIAGVKAINGASLTYFPPTFEVSDPLPSKHRGYFFSGTQYIKLPPDALATGSAIILSPWLTFSAWIRHQGLGTRTIFSKNDGTNNYLTVRVSNSNSIEIVTGSPNIVYAHTNTLVLDTWVFVGIAFAWDSTNSKTTMTYYYDGVQHATTYTNSFIVKDTSSTALQRIGVSASSTDFYQGFIWRIKISNYVSTTVTSDISAISCPSGLSFCLSSCPFPQTPDCQSCSASCSNGCVRTTDCSLCADELCDVCQEFETLACSQCISNTVTTPQCLCVAGRYFDRSSRSCPLCSVECNGCSAYTFCTGCYSPAVLQSNTCICTSAYYPSPNPSNCVSCASTCLTCTSATVCSTCKAHAHLSSSACVCDSGYFGTADNCQVCSSICKECSSTNVCTDCFSPATLSTGTCVCPSTYFPNTSAANCTSCDNTCLNCSNLTTCTSCKTHAHLTSPTCVCDIGYFGTAGNCQQCSNICKACTSVNVCTDCYSLATLSSGTCVCPSTCFPNPDASNCIACNATCLTCSNLTTCTSCKSYAYLNVSSCVCSSGYFGTADNCQACSNICKECSSTNVCTDCFSPATLSTGTCVCPSTYFPNTSAANCTSCNITCLACSNLTTCTSCKVNAHLSSSACVCDIGYFGTADACQQCLTICKECSSLSVCTVCFSTATLNSGICVCPTTHFPSPDATNCVLCSTACLTCSNLSTCTSCKSHAHLSLLVCVCDSGYFGLPDNCQACSIICKECTSVNVCTDCISPAILNANTCVCPSTHFPSPDASNCAACNITCLTCSDLSACTSCSTHAHLSSPFCICDLGYFGTAHNCQACPKSCKECSSLSVCTDCFSPATLSSGNCKCPSTHFPNSDAANCALCSSTCLTCSSFATCTSCKAHAHVFSSACVCDSGYFGEPDNCQVCATICKECISASVCTQCYPPATFNSGSCQCPPSTFPNPDAANCTPCSDSCLTCSNLTTCTSCNAHAHLDSSTCKCDDGYIGSPSNCTPCSSGCSYCESLCVRCFAGFYFANGFCYSTCPQGFQSDSDNFTCQRVSNGTFSASLETNLNNNLLLNFTSILAKDLHNDDFTTVITTVDGSNITTVHTTSALTPNQRYNVTLQVSLSKQSDIPVYLALSPNLTDLTGSRLSTTNLSAILVQPSDSNSNSSAIPSLVGAQVTQAAIVSGLASGILSGNPASVFTMMNNLQLLSYLPLSGINIPKQLSGLLMSLNIESIIPNPFQYLLRETRPTDPPAFAVKYGYSSCVFLANTGLIASVGVMFALSSVFVKLILKCPIKFLRMYFERLLKSKTSNKLVRYWIQVYLDTAIAALLQIPSVSNRQMVLDDPILVSNYALGILATMITISTPFLCVYITVKNRELIRNNCRLEEVSRWRTLFEEFKNDSGAISTCYYSVFFFRRLIYAISLMTLTNYPTIQSLTFIFHSVSVRSTQTLGFILIYRPFNNRIDLLSSISAEICITSVFALTSVFNFQLPNLSSEAIQLTCTILVYSSMAITNLASTMNALIVLKKVWKAYTMGRLKVAPIFTSTIPMNSDKPKTLF